MVTEIAYFDVATNYGNMAHAPETMEDFLGGSSSSRRAVFRNSSRSFSMCSTSDGLSPPLGRIRRHSSRFSNSFSETVIMPEMLEIQGDATLCFDEEGTCFQGVIVAHDDGSHYSIQGKKTQRRKAEEGVLSCGCDETESDGEESGVRVSFDIRIKDHDNPMEYHLRRVHGRNGQVCRFTCSNINFTSLEVFRGHKADMIAQSCLGHHQIHCGRSTVYRGPMSISVESKETPRHWVL